MRVVTPIRRRTDLRNVINVDKLLFSKITGIIKINYLISISLAVTLFRLSFLGLIFRLWFISVQE